MELFDEAAEAAMVTERQWILICLSVSVSPFPDRVFVDRRVILPAPPHSPSPPPPPPLRSSPPPSQSAAAVMK